MITYGLSQPMRRVKASKNVDVECIVAERLGKDPKNWNLSDNAWLALLEKEVAKAIKQGEKRVVRYHAKHDIRKRNETSFPHARQ